VSNGTYLQGDVQNALIRPVRDTTPIQRFYEECRRLDDPARRMGDRGLRAVAEGSLPLDSVNARGEVFVRDLVDDRLLDLYITNAAPSPPPPPTTNTSAALTPAGTLQLIVEAEVNLTKQSPLASRSAMTPVVTSTV
jgi:hypothetical protein